MILELNPETNQGQKDIEREYEKQFTKRQAYKASSNGSSALIIYGTIILITIAVVVLQFIRH